MDSRQGHTKDSKKFLAQTQFFSAYDDSQNLIAFNAAGCKILSRGCARSSKRIEEHCPLREAISYVSSVLLIARTPACASKPQCCVVSLWCSRKDSAGLMGARMKFTVSASARPHVRVRVCAIRALVCVVPAGLWDCCIALQVLQLAFTSARLRSTSASEGAELPCLGSRFESRAATHAPCTGTHLASPRVVCVLRDSQRPPLCPSKCAALLPCTCSPNQRASISRSRYTNTAGSFESGKSRFAST